MDEIRAKIQRDLRELRNIAANLVSAERRLRDLAQDEFPVAGEGLGCTRSGWMADAIQNAVEDLSSAIDVLETFALGDVEGMIREANACVPPKES
jgi:hypothetical protein